MIYQTAEDGLGDTIKPRLLAAGADCSRVLVIDDQDQPLTMVDARLEEAIIQTKDIKLFNNNLDVVDDAFEYLMSKAQKGEKGQYFTPRYVIDMCVKMMNPTIHDKIIDTACGSSGFTVHSIFKVWKEIRLSKGLEPGEDFTASERTEDERNYVTATKTSVLFVQKWDDKLCPKKEDYPIFFATMQKPSKDNSGEKIYVKDENGEIVLDSHNHFIVDHDLYNHDGMTQDGIAEAFIEFAKKEGLSFFQ